MPKKSKPPIQLVPNTGSTKLQANVLGTLFLTLLTAMMETSPQTVIEMRDALTRMAKRGVDLNLKTKERGIVRQAHLFVEGIILTGGVQ